MIPIPKLMTQAPEDIRTDGAILEQDPDELRKAKKRIAEDAFKMTRPEQAYINFSKVSKYVNTLDVGVLQHLGLLPSVFLHEIPDVASPDDWDMWTVEGYSNLVYMAVHAGKYDQSSFATVRVKKEEPEKVEGEEDQPEEEEIEEDEMESSEVWGPYPVWKSKEKIQILKVVMSPLTVFPSKYLFEEYFPAVLRLRFGMPEGNSDYAHWIEKNIEAGGDTNHLHLVLMDAYKSYDKDGEEAGLETANQRLMLSSSVVRNVTATKSSIFSEKHGTYSPMKELLQLPLEPGDRIFMSLALGGGKSTELHVAQVESVVNSMVLIAKHLTPEFILEMVHVFWDGNESLIDKVERTCGLIDEVYESNNEELIKALVKDARPSYEINEWHEKDQSIYKQLVQCKPDSTEARRICRIYFWRKCIQKFVDRAKKAMRKQSWTGTLMEMTLTTDSPRLTASKVAHVNFIDVIDFIEFWRDHDPDYVGNQDSPMMDPRIFNMLPKPFKNGQYHDLRVIHVSNNEELDAFIKTYTMFDIDSTTVQALNSNNVSGLTKDESVLMQIPCPVVTAQRRNWNSTEFFGSRMQIRTSVFDERSSADPSVLGLYEHASCYDLAMKLFGSNFFTRAVLDKDLQINGKDFRIAVFEHFHALMLHSVGQILNEGKQSRFIAPIEPILKMAAVASNYPADEYLRLLENHYPLTANMKKEGDQIAFVEPDNKGLRKLCLSSSRIAVETILEIINRSEEARIREQKRREEEDEEDS